ncbi:MAG TPA: chromate resistance protein ChrB domain-containing protein, partial [Thermoanaerobaculia bacterium]|nr:chromate resistance protein ChrB domain-containing protein [Thermoanaerobaculia bacterium]
NWIGRTWVTRRGIHIDRIASAWLIRRFLDPNARFRFVDAKEPARPGDLQFDMVGGDFTHEGDRCTFETLLARTGVANRALVDIAEIVHDIDLKDGKFARPEAAGIERLLTGLILANPEDEARLQRGFVLFDELYQSFRKKLPASSKEVPK